MRKLIALTLALLPSMALAEPVTPSTLSGLRITGTLVGREPAIQVGSPNGPREPARTVTPFQLAPDLATTLVWLQVRNDGAKAVDVPYQRLRLVGHGSRDLSAMGLSEIKKPWGRYLSWATTPPQGNPLFFEREIAVRAESYLDMSVFGGGTIPPGGRKEGYVAFPQLDRRPTAADLELEIQMGAQTQAVTIPLAVEAAATP